MPIDVETYEKKLKKQISGYEHKSKEVSSHIPYHERLLTHHASSFFEVQWLDSIIETLWPSVVAHLEGIFQKNIEQKLQQVVMEGLHFSRLDFGTSPAQLRGVKLSRIDEEQNLIEVAMDSRWDCEDLNVALSWGMLSVGITRLKVQGILCCALRNFINEPPFIAGATLFFANPPQFDIEFAGVGYVALQMMPFSLDAVRAIIQEQLFAYFVLPNSLAFFRNPEYLMEHQLRCKPEGILTIRKMSAHGLSSLAKACRYCVLKLGTQEARTQCTANSAWNEEFHFIVDMPHDQDLYVEIKDPFDNDEKSVATLRISIRYLVETSLQVGLRLASPCFPLISADVAAEMAIQGSWRWLEFDPEFLSSGRSKGVESLLCIWVDCVRHLPTVWAGIHLQVECIVEHPTGVEPQTKRTSVSKACASQASPAETKVGCSPRKKCPSDAVKCDKVRDRVMFAQSLRTPEGEELSPEQLAWLLAGVDVSTFSEANDSPKEDVPISGSVEVTWGEHLRFFVSECLRCKLQVNLVDGDSGILVASLDALTLEDISKCPELRMERRVCFQGNSRFFFNAQMYGLGQEIFDGSPFERRISRTTRKSISSCAFKKNRIPLFQE